jgi:hypothetical protein
MVDLPSYLWPCDMLCDGADPVNLGVYSGYYPTFQPNQMWSVHVPLMWLQRWGPGSWLLSTKMCLYLSLFRAWILLWSKEMQTNQQVHITWHDYCFETYVFRTSIIPIDLWRFLDIGFPSYPSGGMPAATHVGASACRSQPVMTCPTRPLSVIVVVTGSDGVFENWV